MVFGPVVRRWIFSDGARSGEQRVASAVGRACRKPLCLLVVAWRGRKHLWGQIWASNGAGKMEKFSPYLMMLVLLFCVHLYSYVYFACLISVIRVVSTHCVLILCRIMFITVCPIKRALWIPRMVFVTPMWPELGFGALFLREFMPLGSWFFSDLVFGHIAGNHVL